MDDGSSINSINKKMIKTGRGGAESSWFLCSQETPIKKTKTTLPMLKELPEEILVYILSNVPAECIVNECRRVSKHWKTLTSTPYFTKKHFLYHQRASASASASASILVSYRDKNDNLKVLLLNNNNHSDMMMMPLNFPEEDLFYYTRSELFIFMTYRPDNRFNPPGITAFKICNPITREKVVLNTYGGHICAIFYHPFAMEYRVIWLKLRSSSPLYLLEFKILNLGSPTTTTTKKQQPPTWRQLPDFDCSPRLELPPVFLEEEGALHWIIEYNQAYMEIRAYNASENDPLLADSLPHPLCIDSILVFDINKETFSTMPHPGEKWSSSSWRHPYMHLLELKQGGGERGLLCLCDCSMEYHIEMWVLEDYENRVWVKRHRIFFDPSFSNRGRLKPFGMRNGKLLIHWKHTGVFACHVMNNNNNYYVTELEKILSNVGDITCVNVFSKSLLPLCNHGGSGGGLYIINMEEPPR